MFHSKEEVKEGIQKVVLEPKIVVETIVDLKKIYKHHPKMFKELQEQLNLIDFLEEK